MFLSDHHHCHMMIFTPPAVFSSFSFPLQVKQRNTIKHVALCPATSTSSSSSSSCQHHVRSGRSVWSAAGIMSTFSAPFELESQPAVYRGPPGGSSIHRPPLHPGKPARHGRRAPPLATEVLLVLYLCCATQSAESKRFKMVTVTRRSSAREVQSRLLCIGKLRSESGSTVKTKKTLRNT